MTGDTTTSGALRSRHPFARSVKKLADIAAASALLVITSPLVGVAAVGTVLTSGLPVLFSQERIGAGGVPFRVWKMRTMRVHSQSAEEVGQVTGSHPLVTPWGRLLRRTKVDELPQLLAVVTGSMSLIGPRPTVPEQVIAYGLWERRRLEVAPGLSGWAQVSGNVQLPWAERIALDVWYIDHWSLHLDLRIIFRTLKTVLLGESEDNQAVEEAMLYAKRARGSS